MRILITGGSGFIGTTVIRHLINDLGYNVLNLDKLTYAGNLESSKDFDASPLYNFEKVDICNSGIIERIFSQYKPEKVLHLAAESHVDRSIDRPAEFIQTNIYGTYTMIEVSRKFWQKLDNKRKERSKYIALRIY